jgi:hypothetical protein
MNNCKPAIRIWSCTAYQFVDGRDLGKPMYFIDHVDESGNISVVWDGYTYEDAKAEAEKWKQATGCLVLDEVDE